MSDREIRDARNKAIDDAVASMDNRMRHLFNQGFELGRKMAEKEVRSEWVKYDEGDCVCLHCGFVLDDWTQAIVYSYCPNCGAHMRKGVEP